MPLTITHHQPSDSSIDLHYRISPTTRALLRAVASPAHYAIDVGCGDGRFTLEVAPLMAHTIGIDNRIDAIEKAESSATEKKAEEVSFFVADAETSDYSEFLTYEPFDLVTAHLCFSESIARRAFEALRPNGRLLFVALEASQWKETGQPSRFSFSADQMQALLTGCGFETEYLGLETDVIVFPDPEQLAQYWLNGSPAPKWLNDDRRTGLEEYAAKGGKTFTARSHLVGRARKP